MIREGEVEIRGTEDVFYNPRMEMNRDITIGVLRAWFSRSGRDSMTYADAMTATGIRGIRAELETRFDSVLNDRSGDAVDVARSNLEQNGVDAEVVREDANVFLRKRGFDVVDIDPFGSPIPFADSTFNSAHSLACFTATDTAPLCGAHDSGVRRYSAVPLNTEYHAEMGLRVLIGALVRTGARYDVAAKPFLSHVSDHYVRTYLKVESGAKRADSSLEGLGYISHCFECYYRSVSYGPIFDGLRECPSCGSHLNIAGPLWLDPVREREFTNAVRDSLEEYMGTYDRAAKLLGLLHDELDTPTHYDHHRLCEMWGQTPSKIDDAVERIRESGFKASRTHYSGTSLKTDANIDELTDILSE